MTTLIEIAPRVIASTLGVFGIAGTLALLAYIFDRRHRKSVGEVTLQPFHLVAIVMSTAVWTTIMAEIWR